MKKSEGFTLIEVLVAISLLAIISLLVWQSMGGIIASKERYEKKDQAFRSATLALNLMVKSLDMSVLYTSPDILGLSPSGESSFKSVFIGVNSGDQDKLTFDAFSHVRYLKDSKESDLAEVTFFLEPAADGEPGLFDLKKKEVSPPGFQNDKDASTMTLLENVRELNFRYYNPQKTDYVDEWDTTKIDYVNKLPRAVEISLVIQDPVDEESKLRFSTTALLEMSPGPSDF